MIRISDFQRVQVFTVYIFDNRHLQKFFVRDILNNDRNLFKPGLLRGAKSPFTGSKLIPGVILSDQ